MDSDTVKVMFTAYLATFGGAMVGAAANVAAEGLARKAGTSVEWETLARMSAASCLGEHDRRACNPPRSLAEVQREVERMLAAESKVSESDDPATVLGQILGAWDLASSTADAYTRIGNILRAEGYVDNDDGLTAAGRATAYMERA